MSVVHVYPSFAEALLKGDIAGGLDAVDLKAALLDLDHYTYSDAHTILSDVTADADAVVATSDALTGKTYTGGTLDADNVTILAVTGQPCGAVLIYVSSGGTFYLAAYLQPDTAFTPNGGNCLLQWAAQGILKI